MQSGIVGQNQVLIENEGKNEAKALMKSFEIIRAMVFIIILSMVLAFVPIGYGDVKKAFIISAGVFVLSLIVAGFLVVMIRRH